MKRVLGGALVVAVLGMATGCVNRATPEHTGTKTSDSAGVDTTARPDTVTPHDSATPPDRVIPADQAPKLDTGGSTTSRWAVSAGGASSGVGLAIAVDGSGNTYVTGRFRGTATFGSLTLNSGWLDDIFVAKLDSSGKFVWAVSAGGASNDWGKSIVVDGSGNCHVTGTFEGSATFGKTTLSSKGNRAIFVAKVEGSGRFVWAVSAGGVSGGKGESIAVDGLGNGYVTGKFYNTATFGSTTLTSKGLEDVFVAKMDKGGKFIWAVSAGGAGSDCGYSIALDGSGNSYVTGKFLRSATFGRSTLTSKGVEDIFVAKFDKTGNFVWAVPAGGTSSDYGFSIAVDGSGNGFVAGCFQNTTTIGSTTLTSNWADDTFVARIDSGGKFLWAVSTGGDSFDYGFTITLDSSSNSYVVGLFQGTATFGSTTLTSRGREDIYVAKVDSGGNFVSAVSAGGVSGDGGHAIALDRSGNIYITGGYSEKAVFGSTTLTSKGGSDIFVAKLDKSGKF